MAAPYTLMGWLSRPSSLQNAAGSSAVRIQGHGCIAIESSFPGARALSSKALEGAVGGGLAAVAAPPDATLGTLQGHALQLLRAPAPAAPPAAPPAPASAIRAPAPPPPTPALQAPVAAEAAAQPAAPAEPPKAPAAEHLFRREALAAQYGSHEPRTSLPQPTGSNWGILVVVASLVIVVFAGALLASVEVTVKAPGALRAPEGLRPVESAIAGAIAEVEVRAGDEVKAGQLIAKLAVAQLDASLTAKRQELEALKHQNAMGEATDKAYAERIETALQRRRRVLHSRSQLNQELRAQRRDLLDRTHELVRHGASSLNQELTFRESLHEALDAGQLLRSNLADIDVQLADARNQMAERALARDIALARAQAALLEVETLIAHAEVRSPAAGRVESLLVKSGAVVQAGQLVAQIVPPDAPRSIVAFLPASETAFIAAGTSARVELESLPVSEFGMAQATVRRISSDIADPQEQAAALGQATPGATVRVELEIDSASEQMTPHLRSGERVTVRLHRRERRIISLMFDFARTLLEP